MKRFILLMMILAIQRTILLPYNIAAKTLNNQIIEAVQVSAPDHTLGCKSSIYILKLKRLLILVFEYSFGFETNSPNILLIIKSN